MMERGEPTIVPPTPNHNHPKSGYVTYPRRISPRQEYVLEFTFEYGISENLHPELPGQEERIVDFSEGWMSFSKQPGKNTSQCYTKPLDSLKNWNNRFFWVDERAFPTVGDWCTNALKDEMPAANTYSRADVAVLNTRRTPIQKQPETLLSLVGLSQRYFLGDDVYPTFLHDDDRDMDLFNLISASNPSKVKTGLRPRAAHEVPLLTATMSRVIDMKDPDVTKPMRPWHLKSLPLGNMPATGVASKVSLEEEVAAVRPRLSKKRRRRVNDRVDANAPPKALRKYYASVRPEQSTHGGKTLLTMGLAADSTFITPADTKGVSDPDPLSYAEPQPHPEQSMNHEGSWKSTSSSSMVGSPSGIYQPGWGVTNSYRLDTPDACQDVVDHIVSPGYFSELRHMPNTDFLSQYNKILAQQVAMGSQLRLRFEKEVRLLKKARAQIARRDQRIQAEADMKKAAKAKNVDLTKELESLRTQFSDLQVSNDQLTQQVSTLQTQVTGKERIKAAFEEFKKYKDDRVEKRCAKMDARLDALSIEFNEELYPHMLTAIAGRRWVIRHGRSRLGGMEAYDPEANDKYLQALQELKDLKYPIVDQLEGLKDALMEVIMASLHLESDFEEDAPKWIRNIRPSTSQLKIPVYLEVRDPRNPRAVKEEMLLEEAIEANVSRTEKNKRCLAILLADVAAQTKTSEDDASPRLLRSKSLPPMYNLDWP
nr:hypothetical protein [Tanacetum cinerariifolium]